MVRRTSSIRRSNNIKPEYADVITPPVPFDRKQTKYLDEMNENKMIPGKKEIQNLKKDFLVENILNENVKGKYKFLK